MSLLLVLLALHNPRQALLGTAVVLAGLPVYSAFRSNGTMGGSSSHPRTRSEIAKEV
jgi:hypothetical protein